MSSVRPIVLDQIVDSLDRIPLATLLPARREWTMPILIGHALVLAAGAAVRYAHVAALVLVLPIDLAVFMRAIFAFQLRRLVAAV